MVCGAGTVHVCVCVCQGGHPEGRDYQMYTEYGEFDECKAWKACGSNLFESRLFLTPTTRVRTASWSLLGGGVSQLGEFLQMPLPEQPVKASPRACTRVDKEQEKKKRNQTPSSATRGATLPPPPRRPLLPRPRGNASFRFQQKG